MKFGNVFAIALVASLLVNCGPSEKDLLKAELEQLRQENQAFKEQSNEMTVSIENYKKILKEINANLASIDENAALTFNLKGEMKSGSNVEDQILARIKNIHALMDNSKMKITALDKNLSELRKQNGKQSEEVLKLNTELKNAATELIVREQDFMAMKADFEGEIQDLESAYQNQLRITEDLREMIDRAFFYAGPRKELMNKGIMEIEGGFIGLGRVKMLNTNSPDKYFQKISKEATKNMVFNGKKIELITDHLPASYAVETTDSTCVLSIKDQKEFWKQSNYLVVQTFE